MKKVLLIICLTFCFIGCSSNDNNSNNGEIIITPPTPFSIGDFVSGAHTTSGTASVNSTKTVLSFKNFKTDNGPKLLVYLTTEVGSSDYISLGDLKGIEGDYTYDIPNNTDFAKYTIVDIWCVDFAVSFGHAELK